MPNNNEVKVSNHVKNEGQCNAFDFTKGLNWSSFSNDDEPWWSGEANEFIKKYHLYRPYTEAVDCESGQEHWHFELSSDYKDGDCGSVQPEYPPSDPKEINLEEYQASCHGTEDYWHDQNVGSGGKSLWTYNNDSAHGVDNYCTYSFSGVTPGKWEVQVFIPSNHATTRQACYEVMDGSRSYGAEVDQYTVYDDWVSLGVFEATGNNLKVRLTDMTNEGYGVNWVGFDAIRVIPTDKEVKQYVPSCNPPQP